MCARNRITVVLAILLLGLFSSQSFAQSSNANPKAFGIGQPANVTDLPQGAFRSRLQSLPPKSSAKAMQVLQAFTFSELDLQYLRIDEWGGVFYADSYVPEKASGEDDPPILGESISASETFLLHSRPGAPNVVYLDFDGHVITGTSWNGGGTADPLYASAYNPGNDDVMTTGCNRGAGIAPVWTVNFSSTELARIGEIWHRIAEDMAPWNIDVTTEEPASFNRYTGRVLFTDDSDYCGDTMPSAGGGGVAYVVVFGNSNYHTSTSPALVYWPNLGNGTATYNHEAGSHEFGHNLGLAHDGDSSQSYYPGHGSGDTSPVDLTSWAPIMGVGYYRNLTQWSKGDYPGAVRSGTYQSNADDLAVITSKLGYRSDDHGDTIGTATALTVQGNGTIAATNPENDPHEFSPENKGVIEVRTDLDFFYFDTAAGLVNLTIEPAWAAFYRSTTKRGANLDIEARLMDGAGNLIVGNDPLDDTDAQLSATVAAGRYYLSVDGVGNPGNSNDPANENYGYDDYASLGMYFISGTVQPTSSDVDAPLPNAMTWASVPAAVGATSITMTATTAIDPTGPVEYNFLCQASTGTGCTSSGWQTSTTYIATGLSPGTDYTYVVRARDAVPNIGGDSNAMLATTPPPPPNAPGSFTASAASQTQINLGWTDTSNNEDGFNLRRSTDELNWDNLPDMVVNATSYNDNKSGGGLVSGTQYFYEIRSFNSSDGASAWVASNATTLEDAPDGTPTGLTASTASSSQINLSWVDQSNNASSFKVERSTNGTSGWSNIGSVNPGTQAFSDTGLASGATWYYRVGAFTTGGINYSNVDSAMTDFECTASQPMTSGEWVFFSLPCMPANPSASTVFSAGPEAVNYGSSWWIYTYDNSIPDWVYLDAGDPVIEGKGYLFYSLDAYASAEVAGSYNIGNSISLSAGTDPGIWNLVGNPYNGAANWTSVSVHDGIKSYSWVNMDKKNGQQPYFCEKTPAVDGKCIMWHVMNKWEGNVYVPYDGQSEPGTLATFDAMWVRAHRSITISMAESQAAPAVEEAAPAKTNKGRKGDGKAKNSATDWSVRLVAESGRYRDAGNRLGQAENATDGLDSRDLEEWTPFSSPYLSILFTNPLFDTVDWGYTTDYRGLTRQQQGEWSFVVRASDGISEVTLKWEGAATLFDNALLINEISGETIAVVAGRSYTFDMTGSEHPFRIVFN